MGARAGRVLVATVACLLWLNGCETSSKLGDLFQAGKSDTTASTEPFPSASADDPPSTGSIRPPVENLAPDQVPKGLLGKDPNDDLSLGKKYFRAADFGLAERHFRRAVEQHPRDLESWVGLAASYDRLRRWDFADRAYSYMLRGDYRRAHETLMRAQALDPSNPYIKNNLELLEVSYRKGKAVQ
jgi:tetratricopeptide (TPR) repeat protein